jgi:hypothetical protein
VLPQSTLDYLYLVSGGVGSLVSDTLLNNSHFLSDDLEIEKEFGLDTEEAVEDEEEEEVDGEVPEMDSDMYQPREESLYTQL